MTDPRAANNHGSSGSSVGGVGLQFAIPSADQAQIRGLTITNFQTGLDLGTDSVIAAGNYIGTDSAGTAGLGNGIGVTVSGPALIGGNTAADRNVISGNGAGISVGGSGVVIQGNYIGPDPTGESAIGGIGSGTGITVDGGSGVTIGGTLPGSGNTISGLDQSAIILGNTTGDDVEGNLLGPTASQSSVLGVDIGVELDGGADSNTIGTVGAGANVMAGSADVAVLIDGGKTNTIDGNFIGADSSGTPFSFANDEGLRVLHGSGNTVSNNRISTSNAQGVEIDESPNTFTGNRIDANDSGGIIVNAGGSTIGPGNKILGNQSFGVRVALGNGTRITQNSIDGTNGLGIDLAAGTNNDQTSPA